MKYISIIILSLVIGIGAFFFIQKKEATTTTNPPLIRTESAQQTKAKSEEKTTAVPTKIIIEKLGINAPIESVGLDIQKRMDVPKDPDNAGWYNLGYKPGETGSAVIAGHVDTPTGAPAIFYNLSELEKGDEIKTTDESGNSYLFTVEKSIIYDFDKVPLDEVFANKDKKRLNLITCDGTFDKANKNYTKRRVVYAVAK